MIVVLQNPLFVVTLRVYLARRVDQLIKLGQLLFPGRAVNCSDPMIVVISLGVIVVVVLLVALERLRKVSSDAERQRDYLGLDIVPVLTVVSPGVAPNQRLIKNRLLVGTGL